MRILVSLEPAYFAYQGVLAASIRIMRPRAEVDTATLDALGEEVERFDPQLVICSRPNTVDPGGRIAWIELSVEPTRPSKVCLAGRYSQLTNPTLEALLEVLDEVDELVRKNDDLGRC